MARQNQSLFETRPGPHGRRWMYDSLRGNREIAVAYACAGVPAWQRRAFPFVYPTAMRVIDRYLEITPASRPNRWRPCAPSSTRWRRGSPSRRPYLCGERFGAADLTFAALATSV